MGYLIGPFDYELLLKLKRERLSPYLTNQILDLEFKVKRKDSLNLELELRRVVILHVMGY